MGITSYGFVLAFLPITFLGWTGLNKLEKYKVADLFLVLASLVFIGSYDYRFILIILSTIFMNYVSVYYMVHKKSMRLRRNLMMILVIANLGILVYLKYCNWLRVVLDADAALWKLIIPIGISFYTLEQICFIVDTYKCGKMEYTLEEYVLFSTYFPVIVSGPILRHDDFITQLRSKACRKITPNDISEGLMSFCLGMGKKVIIASYLGKMAAFGFDDVESAQCLTVVLSVLAYTLQLYFDFSGYCDIVEGVSLILGFSLPTNFDSPYKAVSISEFWKRWHMTLTGFLTKYVYIPLGGNRKGKIRQYFNIFIVFLVSGIWHGASFTYVLWGMMHGGCMMIDKMIGEVWHKLPKLVGRFTTFTMVALMWVPFRAKNIHDTYAIYRTMIYGDRSIIRDFGKYTFKTIAYLFENYLGIAEDMIIKSQNIVTVLIMIILIAVVFFMKNVREMRKCYSKGVRMAILCGGILFAAVFQFQEVGSFIYEGF